MPKDHKVIFLYGNDEYAIARRLKEYETDLTDPASADMNTARLDARTMSEDELNNAVNALPFMASRRLVLLGNPSARYASPSARNKFFEFLEHTPETALVLIHELVEPREADKHWLVQWAAKKEALIRTQGFMLPRQREMTGWIAEEAKKQGGQIEPAAADKLAEMVGVDTRQAAQEIAKLLAYVNWERQIKRQDVEAVSIFTAQQSVFDFVNALAAGSGKLAQSLLHRLLETEDPLSMWGMIVRQFRLLIQTREILDSRGNKEDVARLLSLRSFVAEKITIQAKRFSVESLESIYHKLLEIDERVKTGRVTLDLAMEMLVMELAR
jgi:DNA polymerase-3 subunit delta